MKRLLLLLVLSCALYAEEDESHLDDYLDDIDASKETIIDTCENSFQVATPYTLPLHVNPITGDLLEEEADLVVAGCQPLAVRRFYNHTAPYEPRYGGWRYNPEAYLVANFEYARQPAFAAVGGFDGSISFLPLRPVWNTFCFDASAGFFTFTASGQTHPANIRVTYGRFLPIPKKKEYFCWTGDIIDGSGTKRTFSSPKYSWHRRIPLDARKLVYKNPGVWTPYQLWVHEARLPNGNYLCYTYREWKWSGDYPKPPLLESITAYNRTKTKKLGSLFFHCHQDAYGEVHGVTAVGSDGRQVQLMHQGVNPILLKSVVAPGKPNLYYHHQGYAITGVERPEGRLIRTEYEGGGRVAAQYAPVGEQGALVPIGRYVYHERYTEFYNAEGVKTLYHFDDKKRMVAVVTYEGEQPYRTDRFTWDEKTGNCLQKTVEDGAHTCFQVTQYKYDHNQNPIEERVGDGTEWAVQVRTFSEDGFNLLLSESDREGKIVRYRYLPNSNLLTDCLVYEGTQIRQRTFYTYDDAAICIKTIVDDGCSEDASDLTGVTYRTIRVVVPKGSLPAYGLPEVVEERTLDEQGREKLLKRIVYTYTPFGKILDEAHYDAEGVHRYTLHNEYDAQERVIASTDPLGHRTTFTYDANNNVLTKRGPKPGQLQEIIYDKANRPITITDWDDGVPLVTEKRYDRLGRLIQVRDPSGYLRNFTYDVLGRVATVTLPDGAVLARTYDPLGNVLQECDAEGYVTHKRYNFRGQPTWIGHADGTEETFQYAPIGTLACHTHENGAKIAYSYDLFDHPIASTFHDASGALLKTLTSHYSPFCLLDTTDGEGVTTTYHYDYAGRKIGETIAGCERRFGYDALGFLASRQENDLLSYDRYDEAGNLLESTKRCGEQLLFQERYQYNEAGERTQLITAGGIHEFVYSSMGKLRIERDPLGYETIHTYQWTPHHRETTCNARHITTERLYNARGQEESVTLYNPQQEKIASHHNQYNKRGELIARTEEVFEGTKLLRTLVHSWTYGPKGKVLSFVEAGEKQTQYSYDLTGRLATLTKPSGIMLHHEWDALGRLSRYHSVDFDYHYTYDRNDRLLAVHDAYAKRTTTHTYNALGCLTEERLANGLTMRYSYDRYGRRTSTQLPDQSFIAYTHHGAFLEAVSRKGYTFTYHRDLAGYPLQIDLPLGTLTLARDACFRWKRVESPYYSVSSLEYDEVGNLLRTSYRDTLGSTEEAYTYDALNQLISENEHTYAFDSLYNRLEKDSEAYEINTLSQVVEDGDTHYTYDRDGNLIHDGLWSYTYDSQDRLIKATKGKTCLEYTYDSFHRRLSKKSRDTVRYLWEGDHEIGQVDDKERLVQLRVLGEGAGAEIGAALLYELSGKSYIPFHDYRGCVAVLVSCDGAKKESYRYTAFGEELTKGTLSPWRFCSKRVDEETGLLFFGRRYYYPSLGRWMTQDPQGFQDGPNLYAYLLNAPFSGCDPYGLWSNPLAGTRNMGELVGRIMWPLFKGIEWAGRYLPVPILGSFMESLGRWGTGQPFDFNPHKNCNSLYTIEGSKLDGVSVVYENGILTSKQEAIHEAQEISKIHNGVQVDLHYNGTGGGIGDLISCSLAKLGLISPIEKMSAYYYRQKLAQDPDHKFYSYVHSQGGLHAANVARLLTSKEKEHIEMYTFGSATLLDRKQYAHVENYVSRLDPVPCTSVLRYGAALMGKISNVHFLSPHSCNPIKEHGIMGETYWGQMTILGQRFTEKNF